MTTAQVMLLNERSVKSVAKTLGYSDTYTFSKQFKRYHGYSPTTYLEKYSVWEIMTIYPQSNEFIFPFCNNILTVGSSLDGSP